MENNNELTIKINPLSNLPNQSEYNFEYVFYQGILRLDNHRQKIKYY